jgi:hypothetical protein
MINRRRFLTTGLFGASLSASSLPGLGAHSIPAQVSPGNLFDWTWARAELEAYGIPKSWSNVSQGLFPFSPERVLVFRERPRCWPFEALKERLLQRGYGRDEYFSEEKLDYAIWIMHLLTEYYGVPQYFEDWATRLAARENLGPAMGTGGHTGLIHQFQDRFPSKDKDRPVPTQNGLVDWWLVLIPDGVDFQALDDLPTHMLCGLVESNCRGPRSECVCLELVERVCVLHDDWVTVSRMDRLDAVRCLNRRLAEALAKELEDPRRTEF